jgi:hypothetical protein
MRDRLVELIAEGRELCEQIQCEGCTRGCKGLNDCIAKVQADHLLKNGVIVPPCKVGDTLYVLVGEPSQTIAEFHVRTVVFGEVHDVIGLTNKSVITIWDKRWYDLFGKTIFLTREESERALKGEHHAEIH